MDELIRLRAEVAAMRPLVNAAVSVVSMWLDIEVAQCEGEPNPWADREREGSDRMTAQIVAAEEWWTFKLKSDDFEPEV